MRSSIIKKICILITLVFCSIRVFGDVSHTSREAFTPIYNSDSCKLTFEEFLKIDSGEELYRLLPQIIQLKQDLELDETFHEGNFFSVIMTLYALYFHSGDIDSSYSILNDAITTYQNKSSEFNNAYIRHLYVCLGQNEIALKNYDNALVSFHETLWMFEDVNDFGESYATLLMNISTAYLYEQNYLCAKLYIDEAIEVFESLYGSIYNIQRPEHFILVSNYGVVNYKCGNYDIAEKSFSYVIENCMKDGLINEAYHLSCVNFSTMLMEQERFTEALKVIENLHSISNEKEYVILQNIALCYFFSEDWENSTKYLLEMNQSAFENISDIFSNFTEDEREEYWTLLSEEIIFMNNLLAYKSNLHDAKMIAYNNELFCRNFLLNTYRRIDDFLFESEDVLLRGVYENYKRLRDEYTYKTNSISQRDSLYIQIKDYERLILESIDDSNDGYSKFFTDWEDVKQSLDEHEVALEFCYVPIGEAFVDIKSLFGVFIIRHDFESPVLVTLEDSDSIENQINSESFDMLDINSFYQEGRAKCLYDKIWGKISPYLEGVKSIYYSPVGLLSNVNLEVLYDEKGVMLNEKYDLYRVSTTANIANVKESSHDQLKTSVLYGNIKYDETIENMISASSEYDRYSGISISDNLTLRSEDKRGGWGPLPSTKEEINEIESILEKNDIEVSVFEGSSANEESFKALSGMAPDIIHLATHGFVFESQEKVKSNNYLSLLNQYSEKESYMTWSGLLMAGANNIWQGTFDVNNVEDGVLTADEISRMDLSNTKLVVLSACETAKGKVDPIDGVFGLQRAFKRAGVGTIIMSLWKVQDDATSMLMTHFYEYLMSGNERHKALWKAMMDVREVYKDPYYWAGFVMLD